MVEVHPNPDVAMSDAKQQLNLEQFNLFDGRHRIDRRPLSAAGGVSI